MSLRLIYAASPLACSGVGDRMGKNDSGIYGLLEPSSFNGLDTALNKNYLYLTPADSLC